MLQDIRVQLRCIRTTQIYARITDVKVSKDLEMLANILNKKSQ